MEWVQVYDPLGQPILSSLVAGTPIILLLSLLVLGVSAPRAAIAGLVAAVVVAIALFKMPASAAFAAAGYGACFGLMPIAWIVFPAVFLFHLTVRSGQFEVLKRSVAEISPDRRMQALLIAFCFGTILEGAAGFGAPVAICSALLIGIGFTPLYAAGLALLTNTAPVAFGSLGIPIRTLAEVSGLDEMALSQMAGRQLPLFSMVIPVWLVYLMSGWRGIKGCWPAVVVCGGTYATIQFLMSNYHGPVLVDLVGGLGSLSAMVALLRFWQPKEIWRFPDETAVADPHAADRVLPLTARQIAYAWMPWLLLAAMVILWSWPAWKTFLNGGTPDRPNVLAGIGQISIPVPALHERIYRTSPVVPVPASSDRAAKPEKAVYDFNWLSASGTGLFLTAVLAAAWLRIGVYGFFAQMSETVWRIRWAILTIACMLALAYVTKYSGADATLGLAFTKTGVFYPFFAPLLGWLGVALTGSDTSSNALFGSLQRITAEQLNLNSTLIVASNSTGGVMGKMIDAQSIVVAAAATGQSGGEGRILRFVFFHSLSLAILVGLLTLAQAHMLSWMIP
ncbi:MAG: lactate permease LctP family transporter [Planctomycetota bacterium]